MYSYTCSKYREWEDMRRNEPSAVLSHDLSEESDVQHQNSEVWLMTMCFQCIYSHCISLLLKTPDVRAAEFTFDALLPNEVLAWVQFTSSLTAPNFVSSNTKIELSIQEAFCSSSVLVSIFCRRLLFTARVLPRLHEGRSSDPGSNFLLNNLR